MAQRQPSAHAPTNLPSFGGSSRPMTAPGSNRSPVNPESSSHRWILSQRLIRPRTASYSGGRYRRKRYNEQDASVSSLPLLKPQRFHLPPHLHTPQRAVNEVQELPLNRVADLRLLRTTCRRAGRLREAGRCCYSLGVLHDNAGRWREAIKFYMEFLKVCLQCRDTQGEALAYHCLGVDHHLVGKAESDKGFETTAKDWWIKALGHHRKHLNLAGDSEGRFLANLNLSIALAALGDAEKCSIYQQRAQECADELRMTDTTAAHNTAVLANIGLSRWAREPERRLEEYIEEATVSHTRDYQMDMGAFARLGEISADQGDYRTALERFQESLYAAQHTGSADGERAALVNIGIMRALAAMSGMSLRTCVTRTCDIYELEFRLGGIGRYCHHSEGIRSSASTAGPFHFKLLVFPAGSSEQQTHMAVFLECQPKAEEDRSNTNFMYSGVRFQIQIINHKNSKRSITRTATHNFCERELISGWQDLLPIHMIQDTEEGWLDAFGRIVIKSKVWFQAQVQSNSSSRESDKLSIISFPKRSRNEESFKAALAEIAAESTCCICHDLCRNASLTNCGHMFCRECLARWLGGTISSRGTCPKCRCVITNCTDHRAADNIVAALTRIGALQ
ncbi:hypothetical protein FOL47_000665 [Perkinsus chesapeaki]|uniref:Uncharacterized protein n=1 Tax=Perkinsus chesapeaki TaxID=330153 RepID=A0A7J6MLY4_PERCH|nr:hypothetical protein FOL47_000665 [Perkinsus chesapeaki]